MELNDINNDWSSATPVLYPPQVKEIDWEQRRYEIAKTILPRVDEQVCGVLEKGGSLLYESLAKQCAVIACQLADALIEELKK